MLFCFRFTVFTDPEQDNMIPQPRTCPRKLTSADSSSYNRTGNSSGVNSGGGRESGDVRKPTQCNSTNLREIEGSRVCVDFQEIKIQDHIERLPLGRVPRSIIVILHADLVDKFNAGEDVTIVGVVIRQWKPVSRGNRCAIDIAIEANSIVAVNSVDKIRYVPRSLSTEFEKFWSHYRSSKREIEGRNLIIKSVCPQLYGLYFVKLCLLLTIIGGTDTQYDGGVRRRSQSHLLIVGDPGCGKSQLLRFASQLSLRSVVTTGIGTTGAGLTCTAVRDGPDWSLEAGALVLANDGICCIDEFACIREQDRATVHEAMEQQTISIAKAGLVVKLNTRTTVVACCNPKGNYDVTADITTNTAIASPLLSRFDTIIILRDIPNKEWDKQVSTFLLKQAVGSIPTQSNAIASRNKGQVWHVDKLREYVAFVKNNLQPRIGPAARILLV